MRQHQPADVWRSIVEESFFDNPAVAHGENGDFGEGSGVPAVSVDDQHIEEQRELITGDEQPRIQSPPLQIKVISHFARRQAMGQRRDHRYAKRGPIAAVTACATFS